MPTRNELSFRTLPCTQSGHVVGLRAMTHFCYLLVEFLPVTTGL